jgi:hypothetical protein
MHTKSVVRNLKGMNHLEDTDENRFPCGLFYDVVSILEYVVSMVGCLVNYQFERISKELDFVPVKVIFRLFPRGKPRKTSVKITCTPAKIRTAQRPNIYPERYCCSRYYYYNIKMNLK